MTEHIRLPLTQGKHDGNIVFDTDGLEFCSSYGPVYETRARAAYIVQACNAYPALLEASQALLVKLDSIWDWDITPTTTETLDWLDDMLAEEIIKLRNAIAAAEAHDA